MRAEEGSLWCVNRHGAIQAQLRATQKRQSTYLLHDQLVLPETSVIRAMAENSSTECSTADNLDLGVRLHRGEERRRSLHQGRSRGYKSSTQKMFVL